MTCRLYYDEPYRREFDATVVRVERREGRTIVTLDRTAFYPTSGGQPFDTGTLAGLPVTDVLEQDDATIAHVLEPLSSTAVVPGQTVHGVIDWPRRFDHMQQHSGQHVLSAAFERLLDARTVGFHLGMEASTIDLARELPARDIAAAEDEANRIVWEDRPVSTRFVTVEEAAQLPLRKEAQREGSLRLVEVTDFDLSACGGTHVVRTGSIGAIVIPSWERFKSGQRIEFLCGARSLSRFRSLRDTAASSMSLLSVAAGDVPASIERLQADAREQRRAIVGLERELAQYRAQELAASGEATARGRLVARAIDADAGGLKALAAAIVSTTGYIVVLVSTATPALVVVARSADGTIPATQVLAALTGQFGGRGGGKADMAQGGGLNAAPDVILQAARAVILA